MLLSITWKNSLTYCSLIIYCKRDTHDQFKTCKEKLRARDFVRMTISDSGVGMSEEEITKIFQPFYSTKVKGTGMGLAICRRIVNDHGGEIYVDSKLDVGTHFSVVIPVRRN